MIVGIDPSLSCTSVVAGNRDIFEYAASFSSKPPASDGALLRVCRYDDLCGRILTYLKGFPKITAVYLEAYSFGSKNTRAHQTGEYGGLLRYFLLTEDWPVIEVPPTTLKKFATGKGNAKKPIVAACLAKRYQLDLASDDEYDAYGLWRLGCVAEGVLKATTQYEEEAASTVRLMASNVGQMRPQSA